VQINTVDDVAGLEVCGALKNVVALGAGFCDGFGYDTSLSAELMTCLTPRTTPHREDIQH
jgi:glycerol-3-phosphate dehydrogenase (NAD+)